MAELAVAPEADDLEVSLFGPGVGESVLVHMPGGHWLVVDSCVDEHGVSAPLSYLRAIGVDPSTAVRVVVASHWHDDHIRGLAQMVEEASSARVCTSHAIERREVQALISAFGGLPPRAAGGTVELWRILTHLSATGAPLTFLGPQQTVFRRGATATNPAILVTSLSPSDVAVDRAIRTMIARIPRPDSQRTSLPWRNPNDNAIALSIKVGSVVVLLGADLEEHTGGGWSAVLDDPGLDPFRAEVFKVPHHGSLDAFHPRVWDELLENQPLAALTPFRNGNVVLPRAEGIDAICPLVSDLFLTADPRAPTGHVRRERTVEKTIKEVTLRMRRRTWPMGQVRLRRKDLSEPGADRWSVDTFGPAHTVDCS